MVKHKYISVKLSKCPRCKCIVPQTLFDFKNAIYKCSKCNNIHA